jgi:hypothetical protein
VTVSTLSEQTGYGNNAVVASDQHTHQQASVESNLQSSESMEIGSGDIASIAATAGDSSALGSIQESLVESLGTEGELTYGTGDPVIENLP